MSYFFTCQFIFFRTHLKKMTRPDKLTGVSPIITDCLSIFNLFVTCWNIISNIGNEYTEIAAFDLTNELFKILLKRWDENKWDRKELEKICDALGASNEMLNPNLFFGKEFAYIDHIKSWY